MLVDCRHEPAHWHIRHQLHSSRVRYCDPAANNGQGSTPAAPPSAAGAAPAGQSRANGGSGGDGEEPHGSQTASHQHDGAPQRVHLSLETIRGMSNEAKLAALGVQYSDLTAIPQRSGLGTVQGWPGSPAAKLQRLLVHLSTVQRNNCWTVSWPGTPSLQLAKCLTSMQTYQLQLNSAWLLVWSKRNQQPQRTCSKLSSKLGPMCTALGIQPSHTGGCNSHTTHPYCTHC